MYCVLMDMNLWDSYILAITIEKRSNIDTHYFVRIPYPFILFLKLKTKILRLNLSERALEWVRCTVIS